MKKDVRFGKEFAMCETSSLKALWLSYHPEEPLARAFAKLCAVPAAYARNT